MAVRELEVTFHGGAEGEECIQLSMSREVFAEFMGYSSLSELMENHGSWEAAIQHWKERWLQMGFQPIINL